MLNKLSFWRWICERRRSVRGQSIVELGLITPIVLVALYIPADFGISMFVAHLTQNVVREAARVAVSTIDPVTQSAVNAVKADVLSKLPARLTSRTVTVRYFKDTDPASPTTNRCTQNIVVTAQGSYTFFLYQILRLFGSTVPNTVTITRTSRMRYEFQPASWGGGLGYCNSTSPPSLTSA